MLALNLAAAGLFALLTPPTQAQGIGDPTFPNLGNKGYKASHYDLKLKYDPATAMLHADVTMTATPDKALGVFSVDFTGFTISSVRVNGLPAKFARANDKLTVTLAKPLPAAKAFILETVYQGKPQQHETTALPAPFKVGWVSFTDGAVAVCEPDVAHTWFPCNDHPRNKATFDFEITVPEGFTAIANGAQIPGTGPTHFRMDKPIQTCMATVAVGKFDVTTQVGPNNLPMHNYTPFGMKTGFANALANDPKYMQLLTEKLGPYPFATYGTIMLPQQAEEANSFLGAAALETASIPVFGFGIGTDPGTLIHEMAHQWMGDCVSVTTWGDDIWWVEGFAQYSEWLRVEAVEGRAGYDAVASSTYKQFSGEGRWLKPGHLEAADMFGAASYLGGALTFHALRMKLGDEKFFAVLRKFIERNRYGNASASDWIKVATEVSGQDMKPFFEAWLYGDTIPKIGS